MLMDCCAEDIGMGEHGCMAVLCVEDDGIAGR